MSIERAQLNNENDSVPKLKRIIMQLTAKCNSNCYFCMNGGTFEDVTPFRLEDYKKVINDLREAENTDLQSIAFTGGEPLLEKEKLLDIAKFNKSLNFNTMLVSNAILMTKKLAEELYQSGVNIARVSLDTHIKEEYDSIRGIKDGFERAVEGVKLMLDAGVKVIIRFTLTERNINDLLGTYKLCNEIGVDEFQLRVVSPHGRSSVNFLPPLDQIENAFNSLFEIEEKVPITTPCLIYGPCTPAVMTRRMKACPCAKEWMYVKIDGSMYPCNYFPEYTRIGNFYEDDINALWASNKYLNIIRNHIPAECSECEDWENCLNQCQGLVYTLTDDFEVTCYNSVYNTSESIEQSSIS